MMSFIILLLAQLALTTSEEVKSKSCAVSSPTMWNENHVALIPIKWLRVTKKYKTSTENEILYDDKPEVMRTSKPWQFHMFVHGAAYDGEGKLNDVVSANIGQTKAPYCDPDMVTLAIRIMEKKGPGNFLDIGSNIGSCALTWAAIGHHVYSVEPMSFNVKLIQKSIAENNKMGKLKGNITVLAMGAADINQADVPIYLAPHNSGNNRIGGEKVALKQTDLKKINSVWQCENIQIKRLDDVLPKGMHFDVAKLDVQGYEYKALKGLSGVMDKANGGGGIDYIYYEVEKEMLEENGDSAGEILHLMESYGYKAMNSDRRDKLFTLLDISPPQNE